MNLFNHLIIFPRLIKDGLWGGGKHMENNIL